MCGNCWLFFLCVVVWVLRYRNAFMREILQMLWAKKIFRWDLKKNFAEIISEIKMWWSYLQAFINFKFANGCMNSKRSSTNCIVDSNVNTWLINREFIKVSKHLYFSIFFLSLFFSFFFLPFYIYFEFWFKLMKTGCCILLKFKKF